VNLARKHFLDIILSVRKVDGHVVGGVAATRLLFHFKFDANAFRF
jgi:hypothetical protein